MNQNACRDYAFRSVEGEEWTFQCFKVPNNLPKLLWEQKHTERL